MARIDLDTGSDDILAHVDDGVIVLTLNRPQARNAMSGGMTAGLEQMLDLRQVRIRVTVIHQRIQIFQASPNALLWS